MNTKAAMYSIGARRRPMTAKESQACVIRYRSGDEAALEELIVGNYRLIITIAGTFRCDIPFEDLVQEGAMKMMVIAKRFDPNRGEFGSFAAASIRNHLRRLLRRENRHHELVAANLPDEPMTDEETEATHAAVETARETARDILPMGIDYQVYALSHGLNDGVKRTQLEVAGIVGMTPGQVRQRLAHSTEMIRRNSGEEEAEEAVRGEQAVQASLWISLPGIPAAYLEC